MLIDPAMAAALRGRRAALEVLVEIDHPDGRVHLWSGIGTLHYRGVAWKGAGTIGQITVAPRTTELRIDEVRLTLSGVDPEALMRVDMEIRNRIARTWLAAIGPGSKVVGTPRLLDEILLDHATDTIGEDGTAAITLIGQAGFWTLERSTETAWSREEGIHRFGVDGSGDPIETGFDYITSLKMKDTKWQPPTS
jgi:hypothetical protein